MPTPLDSFLVMLKPSTQKSYRKGVIQFLDFIYGSRDPGLPQRYVDEVKAGRRDLAADLTNYFGNKCSHYAPTTYRFSTSIIKQFLLYNEIELPPILWRRVVGRMRGNRPLTMDQPPTPDELRRILEHSKLPYRAIFLILATSGLRVAELQQIRLTDVDLSKDPVRIQVRAGISKSKAARLTFMSQEAKESLEEWLKIRENYIRACTFRGGRSSSSIFPFDYHTIVAAWQNGLRKAGLDDRDPQTQYRVRHLHTLRKFFRTRLGSVINADVVEALMGHEGGIQAIYRRYTPEDLSRFYSQGEAALAIMADSQAIQKAKEIEKENETLRGMLSKMETDTREQRESIRKIQESLKRLHQ
jgi:integrase